MALNINSSFLKFWDKLIDLLFLNLIMLVCCIPIVTIGPAVTAAYAVLLKMVDDEEGYIYKSYFKYFKSNFKKGMIFGILFMAAVYALYIEWQIVTKMNDVNLVGFIHQYGENDFSIWNLQLSDEDQKAIEAILDKYRANGISVRGNSEMKLEEVF